MNSLSSKIKRAIKTGQLELWQRYSENKRKNPRLTYLFWESTLRCNLTCRHCGSSCGNRAVTGELKTKEIKQALEEISKDFPAKKIMLAITGGESLLRKDIFEVIEFADKLGFNCGMVTNGLLLTVETVKKLKNSGIKSISISLDGLRENHEFIRGKDTFGKTLEGIRNMIEEQFTMSEIITCVYQRNVQELNQIYRLVKKLGVKSWRLFAISPIGRAKNQKDLFLSPEQFKYFLDFIKEKRKKDKNLKISFMEQGFLGIDYENEVRGGFFFCLAGINVGSILYDGSISACPSLPREFIQGNIRKDKFKNVWDNKFKEFRQIDWKKQGICHECEQWDYCHGNGMHLWDFGKSEPSICEYRLLCQVGDYC